MKRLSTALRIAGMSIVSATTCQSQDALDAVGEKLARVRYIAPALMHNGSFIDATPIRGNLSEPNSPVFVSYAEVCAPLQIIGAELTKELALLAANIRKNRIDDKALTATAPKCAVVLYDGSREPVFLVEIQGAAPMSFCKPHMVSKFAFQADSSQGVYHTGVSTLLVKFKPYVQIADAVADERARWLAPKEER